MNKIQRNERSRVKLALQMVLRDITSFHLPRPTPSLYFPSSKSKRNWLHTGITFSRTEETFQLNREGKAKRKPGGFYSQILVIHSWIIRVLIGFARNLSPRPHPLFPSFPWKLAGIYEVHTGPQICGNNRAYASAAYIHQPLDTAS